MLYLWHRDQVIFYNQRQRFKVKSHSCIDLASLDWQFFLFSHSLPPLFRWGLPWLRRELRIPTLWGSAYGSTNERAWGKELWAGLRTSSPSSWRVWCPRWFSSGHGVRTGSSEDERRPCFQYLLSLWQRRAGQFLTVDVSTFAVKCDN